MVRLNGRWWIDRLRSGRNDFELPERLGWPAAALVIIVLSVLLWYAMGRVVALFVLA